MADMRPLLDDEINAAWHEVNKARAERDRYRAALKNAQRDIARMLEAGFDSTRRDIAIAATDSIDAALNQEQKP